MAHVFLYLSAIRFIDGAYYSISDSIQIYFVIDLFQNSSSTVTF